MLTGCDYILQTEKFTKLYIGEKYNGNDLLLEYYRKETGT